MDDIIYNLDRNYDKYIRNKRLSSLCQHCLKEINLIFKFIWLMKYTTFL